MTFVNPWMLFGLAAIAIPVIVHLFNFRRYRKVYFSNVEFLENLIQETRHQSTLRQFLILAARILAITFLVLAFAQPIITRNNTLRPNRGDLVCIYLDNSYSMENMGKDGTLLEMGKVKVREIVSAYKPATQFQLLTNEMRGGQFRFLSKSEVLEALDEVETSARTIKISEVVARQTEFLRNAHKGGDLYVVSDMQRSTSDLVEVKSDSTINITLVPLKAASMGNLYIDTIELNAPCFQKGNTIVAKVRIQNTGNESLENIPLTLFVNDKQRALATHEVPAHGSADVEMSFVVDEVGVLDCYVETTDYPITFDDRYYFAINVANNRQVSIINGNDNNVWLDRLFNNDSAIRYRSMDESQIDFDHLNENQMIVLNEIKVIRSGLSGSLTEFVSNGGTLVIIPHIESDLESYNMLLRALNTSLFDHWSKGTTRASGIATEHPIYRNVFTKESPDLELPTIQGHFSTRDETKSNHETIITLSNGDDYIYGATCGNGRVYVCTTPLREEMTDFGHQSMFVPTFFNMALYSMPMGNISYSMEHIAPIPLQIRLSNREEIVHFTGKNTDFIPDTRTIAGRALMMLHGDLNEAGCYRLRQGNTEEGIAFNYSRLESEMDFLSSDDVAKAISESSVGYVDVVRNADKNLESHIRQQHEGKPLWRWCIIGCLLMLAGETLMLRLPYTKTNKENAHA